MCYGGGVSGADTPQPPDWDGIIAHICHLTGWRWDDVEDTLTIPRLEALIKEWKRHPPLPLLVAAFMGVKPEEEATPQMLAERLQGLQNIVRK